MSRLSLFVGILILLGSSIVAAEKLYLDAGQGVVINGKNITFLGVLYNGVNIQVDVDYGYVPIKNVTHTISGVFVTLLGLSKNPPIAILEVSVPFSCGDGACSGSSGEDYASCCKDCGCLGEKACISNACVSNITSTPSLFDCQQDSDCSPSLELCTSTFCNKDVIPYQCVTKELDTCTPNDSCCPTTCDVNNDNDCLFVDQCVSDQDCEDGNPCTLNTCAGAPKNCQVLSSGGCQKEGQCIPSGTIDGFTYCSDAGTFFSLKENGERGNQDYECITKNCDEVCKRGLLERLFPYTTVGIFFICVGLLGFYLYALILRRMEQE